MGRPSHTRQLAVWMNGERVGEWRVPGRGPQEFHYDPAWLDSPQFRPLSLAYCLNIKQCLAQFDLDAWLFPRTYLRTGT